MATSSSNQRADVARPSLTAAAPSSWLSKGLSPYYVTLSRPAYLRLI